MVSIVRSIDRVHQGVGHAVLPDGEHVDVVIYSRWECAIAVDVFNKQRQQMGEGTIKDTSYIQSVGTWPDFRQRGVGTLVMNTLIDVAKQMGKEWVYLNTTDMGLYLYPKVGFIHEGFFSWDDYNDCLDWHPLDQYKMIYHMPGRSKMMETVINVDITPHHVKVVVEGEEHGRRNAWFPVIEREGQMVFRFFSTWLPLAAAYGLLGTVV